jgi:lipopolysaccharide/colanic/teichoic acid biosynthesis glycosyltransferase
MDVVQSYTDWHRLRLVVRPGLTGPAQIGDTANLSLDDRVRAELDYIKNSSLWQDVRILARAVGAMFAGVIGGGGR